MIQFVRHFYNLGCRNRRLTGSDTWTLDITSGEVGRAGNGQHNPTFTLDPQGAGNVPPLVYPGPDPGGNPAIVA